MFLAQNLALKGEREQGNKQRHGREMLASTLEIYRNQIYSCFCCCLKTEGSRYLTICRCSQ